MSAVVTAALSAVCGTALVAFANPVIAAFDT